MRIRFFKYQGCGNDFIVADGRDGSMGSIKPAWIRKMCDRRFGIGADGFMILEGHEQLDFAMRYHNADGLIGSMCGNGGRCMVAFARKMGICKEMYRFMASDGMHEAEIDANNRVRLKMKDVDKIEGMGGDFILDTGSPHFVRFVEDAEKIDVEEEGKAIRYADAFRAQGINVNFVERLEPENIFVRTYERGVEGETYSCGTGVTASALLSADTGIGKHRIHVKTLGGEMMVAFERAEGGTCKNIWLTGPAEYVFSGEIETEGWE